MRVRSATYAGIAAFPLAVAGVHRLRYVAAYGQQASAQMQAEGHAYLGALSPVVMVLVAVAVGAFLGRLAEHWQGRHVGRAARARRLWLVATLGLLAVYTAQETLEGLLATGHPGGLTGVFGNGGLWALPAACLFGGGLALLMRGGHRIVRAVREAGKAIARAATPRLRVHGAPACVLISRTIGARRAPLAWHRCARGPPAAAAAR